MIRISGSVIDPNAIMNQIPQGDIEKNTFDILSSSSKVYSFKSLNELNFELSMRKSIVNAAIDLNNSSFSFRVFRKSRCNPDFWDRTNDGGFLLKKGVNPSDAIKDIYVHSSKYGTECATAMVIVYYKAVLDVFPEELFNRLFPEIYLMNWSHLDRDLGIREYGPGEDDLPGDGMYFKNPDVNPLTPEWQGENVIYLGNGKYYGHGIGISDEKEIIRALNDNRISGSTVSAYRLDSVKRLDFKYLAQKYNSFTPPRDMGSYNAEWPVVYIPHPNN
ncbi:MAG: protein-glutamine gamma-glutamyltransferase [Clostridiales bacterium]|jgi:protein-glutamine gamma-glutamyltransferase|nr:protein-glutamine gamma-glutamyltransferase [Eubacteriales bacterium]MDH7565681.1 protein-glutamine gamma-glutamyltransferase [Clostridiales bacterium]